MLFESLKEIDDSLIVLTPGMYIQEIHDVINDFLKEYPDYKTTDIDYSYNNWSFSIVPKNNIPRIDSPFVDFKKEPSIYYISISKNNSVFFTKELIEKNISEIKNVFVERLKEGSNND